MKALIIVALLNIHFLYAQNVRSFETNSTISIEQLSLYPVLISESTKKGTHMGTGNIIKHRNKYYLVTALHVIDSLGNDIKITFSLPENTGRTIDLVFLLDFPKIVWKKHLTADLALIELNIHSRYFSYIKERAIPSENIFTTKVALPYETAVSYLGYPIIDEIGKYFSPTSFKSTISSKFVTISGYKGIKSEFFFLNIPSMQGCSGGAVYINVLDVGGNGNLLSINNKQLPTSLVGFISLTKNDNTGGKVAGVVPAYFILDLLDE